MKKTPAPVEAFDPDGPLELYLSPLVSLWGITAKRNRRMDLSQLVTAVVNGRVKVPPYVACCFAVDKKQRPVSLTELRKRLRNWGWRKPKVATGKRAG